MFDSSEKEHVLLYGNNAPKQARGRLVKAGANRNPWIHCDYFGFGFL